MNTLGIYIIMVKILDVYQKKSCLYPRQSRLITFRDHDTFPVLTKTQNINALRTKNKKNQILLYHLPVKGGALAASRLATMQEIRVQRLPDPKISFKSQYRCVCFLD